MTKNALSGAQLELLLDRLEADLEENESAEAIDLLGRLRASPLRADSLAAVDRLHTLWMYAGDAQSALAVIDADGGALEQAAAPHARADLRMRLALWRAQIAAHGKDEDAARAALADMLAIAVLRPGPDGGAYRHLSILDDLEQGPLDIALETIELRHTLDATTTARATLRARDMSKREQRRTAVFSRHGRTDEAEIAASAATAALQGAGPYQDVDQNDWLRLGAALVETAPARMADVHRAVTALASTQSLPQRRETQVRLARLTARALHAQGDLQGALDVCAAARYALSAGGGDDFIDYELPWLVEAGRTAEAGRRAFFEIYHQEQGMWKGAATVVHAQLVEPSDASVWWPLCVMRACNTGGTLACLLAVFEAQGKNPRDASALHRRLFSHLGAEGISEADRVRVFSNARALALERAPHEPWIDRLGAIHDMDQGTIDSTTAAARLFAAALRGDMNDHRTAYAIFSQQLLSLGLAQALKLSPPQLDSGLAGYSFALDVEGLVEDMIETAPDGAQAQLRTDLEQLQRAAYEQGQVHFERYFATGRGQPLDGSAQNYSVLCNNVAIRYRYGEPRLCDALELHRSDIEASPFAEHYADIMTIYKSLEDDAELVMAAERLWHYAAENCYGRNDPNYYLRDVSRALCKLDRDSEILIWLERLVQWQRNEGEDERRLSLDALVARCDLTIYLALRHPEEANAIWIGLEPQVRASQNWLPWIKAGDFFYALERRSDSIPWYEQCMLLNPRETENERASAVTVEARLAVLKPPAVAAPPKSRWKFWQ